MIITNPLFKPEESTGSTRIHRIHQDPPGGSVDPPPKPYVYKGFSVFGDLYLYNTNTAIGHEIPLEFYGGPGAPQERPREPRAPQERPKTAQEREKI